MMWGLSKRNHYREFRILHKLLNKIHSDLVQLSVINTIFFFKTTNL